MTQPITSLATLRDAIVDLELRKREQEHRLTASMHEIREKLRPVNIIKNTVRSFVDTPDHRHDLLNTVAGIALGYLTKKLFFGSGGIIKKLLGNALQFGLAGLFRKKGDVIKESGIRILRSLTHSNGNGHPEGSHV